MDGYFFVVDSTYKPVHGECSPVAGGSDGLWLSDHTSNSCTLYTRGINLGGDPGARYLTAGASVSASHWSHAGWWGWWEVRGGTCLGWRHLNKPYYDAFVSYYINSFLTRFLPPSERILIDSFRIENWVKNKSVSNIQAANTQPRFLDYGNM
jgi:hypothetical protein